jgi:hypothetical protein
MLQEFSPQGFKAHLNSSHCCAVMMYGRKEEKNDPNGLKKLFFSIGIFILPQKVAPANVHTANKVKVCTPIASFSGNVYLHSRHFEAKLSVM